MRAYLELGLAGFRRYSTYRLAIFAGVFTQSVFGFIRVSVLFAAIAAAGGTLAGYDDQSVSTYVWLGQALLARSRCSPGARSRTGSSPGRSRWTWPGRWTCSLGWWAGDLGRASFQLLTRGLPPLFIGRTDGISVSFFARVTMNLIASWTLDVRGFVGLYIVAIGPFSGLFVPIDLFPEPLRTIAYATPFPAMFQLPIDVLSGRVLGTEALAVVGVQCAWLAGLILLGQRRELVGGPPSGSVGSQQ